MAVSSAKSLKGFKVLLVSSAVGTFMRAWDGILRSFGERTQKPWEIGLTMMIDVGMGTRTALDVVETGGDYIDIVKLTFGTGCVCDEAFLTKKVAIYRDADIDVMPGGTLLEAAIHQRVLDEFLDKAKEYSFSTIEVSDGTISMTDEQRRDIIRTATSNGFGVLAEVGKKFAEADTAVKCAEGIKRDLKYGVSKVIIESREAGKDIGIYGKAGEIREDRLRSIFSEADINKVLFEAPLESQQKFLILRFGPNANLGNVHHEHIMKLEATRRGLRADTLAKAISEN